jgi:hypothetical protein
LAVRVRGLAGAFGFSAVAVAAGLRAAGFDFGVGFSAWAFSAAGFSAAGFEAGFAAAVFAPIEVISIWLSFAR